MVQVLVRLGLVGSGIKPLCVRSHIKFVVTNAVPMAAGASVAGAVAVIVMLPAEAVVEYDEVPVHVVDVFIGRDESGAAQSKGA